MGKYNYLSALRERSDTLFYRLVIENLRECLPLIYTPTVGQACLEFGLQYRAAEGMYISKSDKGCIRQILNNWRPNTMDEVAIIVITDGSRILGLGDLGANGMGIPIGKLSLYVAAAGFHPASTLPIVLDTGTNNESLLNDEFYLGARHKRLSDEEYYPLIDELLMGIKDKWPRALLQFEDFSNDHCFELLERYRKKMRCFNDDIQGTGAVIAAGFLNAVEMSGLSPREHKVIFLGAGSAGIGVANMLCAVLKKKYGIEEEEARQLFYLVDSKGLVAKNRKSGGLQDFKLPFARTDIPDGVVDELKTLEDVVSFVKPTGLVGLSGQGGHFTAEILKQVATNCQHPIIFPLSNPTSKSECSAEDAFKYSEGRCIFASGSPYAPVTLPNGEVRQPSQGNNMYIFPGLGFGAWISRAREVSEAMIIEAAVALSEMVTPEHKMKGEIYPPLENIRSISKHIAARVIKVAFEADLCEHLPASVNGRDIDSLEAFVAMNMYDPSHLEAGLRPVALHPAVVMEENDAEDDVKELDI
eukprot:GDKJ01052083.1.p1 GENE.GDKJ01052083.1~~GDKJ01052083.1.p1  ORF type:complete len:610 (+),score=170.42 GDKJ01052083.1:245-1831(+)